VPGVGAVPRQLLVDGVGGLMDLHVIVDQRHRQTASLGLIPVTSWCESGLGSAIHRVERGTCW
jgi:hypothetical protein